VIRRRINSGVNHCGATCLHGQSQLAAECFWSINGDAAQPQAFAIALKSTGGSSSLIIDENEWHSRFGSGKDF
jgi:hypothetical protein